MLYYLITILESLLAVFGIRSSLEEARYTVTGRLDRGVEIRAYAPRKAVETDLGGRNGDADAFRRLFAYISGANIRDNRIAMTAPVEKGERVAMTVPVQEGGQEGGGQAPDMRFFLPDAVAADPPKPTDPRVRVVAVPEEHLAVLRFNGRATRAAREEHEAELLKIVAAAGRKTRGPPFFMGYDPPFTIPFLRRNEVAVALDG